MSSLKRKVYKKIKILLCICLTVAQRILWRSGLFELYLRIAGKGGAIILMYHSIVDTSNREFIDPAYALDVNIFEKQMKFLANHRNVISMSQLIDDLEKGASHKRGTVVITFDDGYLDNYTIAAPILDKYNLPATINLASGYVTRNEPQWMDQVHYMFETRTQNDLSWSYDGKQKLFNLRKESDLKKIMSLLVFQFIESKHDERLGLLSKIKDELKPSKEMPRITLGWDDVRKMKNEFPAIEIGAHTHDHVSLTTLNREKIIKDIVDCKATIETQTGDSPLHFTYPYGRVDPEVRNIIESLGFKSAARTDPADLINNDTDRFQLSRLDAPKSMSLFKALTSGATLPKISKRLSCNI